jgi:hypothetical protein
MIGILLIIDGRGGGVIGKPPSSLDCVRKINPHLHGEHESELDHVALTTHNKERRLFSPTMDL